MLHPQLVQKIWEVFGKAKVSLFVFIYFSKSRNALAHNWPNLLLYAFPHRTIGDQEYQRTGSQGAVCSPTLDKRAVGRGTIPAACCGFVAHPPETGPPLSGRKHDLAPTASTVGPAPLAYRWEPMALSDSVMNTLSQARAPSTQQLYALKWPVFTTWCLTRGVDPVSCDVSLILSFLQELLDKGHSPSTLKVYVAAISASHAPIADQTVGKNDLIVRFLKDSRRLRPPRPLTVPSWYLPTVLRALKSSPFKLLQSVDLRSLTLKMALLLALVSVKSVGDLQAFSVSLSCLEFGPGNSRLVLKPRHGYVPKVLSTPFMAQVVTLYVLPSSEQHRELNLLCPVRALRVYIECSAPFRQSEQLFVCFGSCTKGSPVTKQRLSKWIIEAISLAYSSLGLPCPTGVRAHSTRGVECSIKRERTRLLT